ncbi:serine hydrolase domain-containing protein [Cytobacillus praedii]|uniref:Class A beta-lactamase-related serine hydrolase n=1 Tax=Cytobacillus praedii TaxID=1742358 RepID=A0A4R1APW6_9BACI|nr:serine hydrolase domain-containing protein [Cytobacillus praedii]TCJ01983.1 class A beta-lactamase-related serine hydrolase [Cytobacillus praedii]
MKRYLFTFVCFILIFPLHTNADSQKQIELIEKYMETALDKYQIPGASLAIVREGQLWFQKSWGIQGNGDPVTEDTLFTIGSVSKPLTSLAIMKLVEKGMIELDQEIDYYLPSFQYNVKGFDKKITIRNLLTHTSGISSYEGLKIADQNLRGEKAISEAVKKLNHVKLTYEPGSVHQYSAANYLLLGRIIEKITGETFSDFMDTEIYTSLGMNRTVSSFEEASKLGYQPGYHSFFGKPIKSKMIFDDSGVPYGYIASSANDMAKYLLFLLDSKDLLSDELFKEYISPQVHRKDEMYYGLGWRISTDNEDPYIFHGGETPDSRAELYMNHKNDYGFILLTNKNDMSETMSTLSMREGIKTIMERGQMPELIKMNYQMQWIPLLLTILFAFCGSLSLYRLKKKTSFHYMSWNIAGFFLLLCSFVFIPIITYIFGAPWHSIYHYSFITAIFILSFVGILAIYGFLILVWAYKKKQEIKLTNSCCP